MIIKNGKILFEKNNHFVDGICGYKAIPYDTKYMQVWGPGVKNIIDYQIEAIKQNLGTALVEEIQTALDSLQVLTNILMHELSPNINLSPPLPPARSTPRFSAGQ